MPSSCFLIILFAELLKYNLPVKMSTQSGEVVHPRSEATQAVNILTQLDNINQEKPKMELQTTSFPFFIKPGA